MYNCRQPRASPRGLALAGTRRAWGQFGTPGVPVRPLEQCHSARSDSSSRLESRWSRDFSGSQARRSSQGCRRRCPGQGCVLPAQGHREERQPGAAAVSPSPCAHEGRDGCWVKSHGQAWGQRGLQLVAQWARGKMPFCLSSREQH